MECNFTVGQKVVLVRSFGAISSLRAAVDGVTLPVQGVTYTVREFDPDLSNGVLCIRLVELMNEPHDWDGLEPSFEASLFRPVVERKTDISCFKAMLNPSKEQVTA